MLCEHLRTQRCPLSPGQLVEYSHNFMISQSDSKWSREASKPKNMLLEVAMIANNQISHKIVPIFKFVVKIKLRPHFIHRV